MGRGVGCGVGDDEGHGGSQVSGMDVSGVVRLFRCRLLKTGHQLDTDDEQAVGWEARVSFAREDIVVKSVE